MAMIRHRRELKDFLGWSVSRFFATHISIGLMTAITEGAFATSLTLFLKSFQLIQSEGDSYFPLAGLTKIGAFIAVVATVSARGLIQWGASYYRVYVSENFRYRVREALVDHTLSESSAQNDLGRSIADFGAMTMLAGDCIHSLQIFLQTVSAALFLAALLLRKDPFLFLISNGLIVLMFPLLYWVNRRVKKAGQAFRFEWTHVLRRFSTTQKNLLFLDILGLKSRESVLLKDQLATYRRDILRYKKFILFSAPFIQWVGALAILGVVIFGRTLAWAPEAFLVSYLYLFFRYAGNCSASSGHMTEFIFLLPNLEHIRNLWTNRKKQKSTSESKLSKSTLRQGRFAWRVESVDFSFDNSQSVFLKNLSLSIPSGSFFAVKGESGVGKSTVLNLLVGRLKPLQGRVLIENDGQWCNASELRDDLLHLCGYVGPESYMIEGDLMDNLLFGLAERPSDAEIQRCLELAECKFVEALPGGLSYRIDENGKGLSSGERQRICLVRALLRHPKILILDEATGQLDSATEYRIARSLKKLTPSMTILSASHRDSFLECADLVIDLNKMQLSL